MIRKVLVLLVFLAIATILVSCGSEPEQTANVLERGNFQGGPFTSELPIANCDSEKELQTAQRIDQKYTHEVKIVSAPNAKVNETELAKTVREHYEVESLVEIASYAVNANVPSGYIYTYVVEWTELWREGDIEIGEIDDDPEATYEFLESLTGGVTSIKSAACSSND